MILPKEIKREIETLRNEISYKKIQFSLYLECLDILENSPEKAILYTDHMYIQIRCLAKSIINGKLINVMEFNASNNK